MTLDEYTPPQSGDELLRRYNNGERYFVGAELDGSSYDLRNINLEGADLSRSFITADFGGARLRGVNFTDANVKTCDFSGADLRGTVFSGAALDATEFEGADLEGANFEGAHCQGHSLGAGEQPSW